MLSFYCNKAAHTVECNASGALKSLHCFLFSGKLHSLHILLSAIEFKSYVWGSPTRWQNKNFSITSNFILPFQISGCYSPYLDEIFVTLLRFHSHLIRMDFFPFLSSSFFILSFYSFFYAEESHKRFY